MSDQGYNLFVIWECEWDRLVQSDEALKEFLDTLEITDPLHPREAFFGGRTNAITLYSKVDKSKGEEIRYIDVTSLYPWVNKYAEYPIGHPEIITNPENQDITSYFGIAKVTIIPPFQLFHPVLPYRCKGKLVFPLCKTCAETEMRKEFTERSAICNHSSEERAITGTWCNVMQCAWCNVMQCAMLMFHCNSAFSNRLTRCPSRCCSYRRCLQLLSVVILITSPCSVISTYKKTSSCRATQRERKCLEYDFLRFKASNSSGYNKRSLSVSFAHVFPEEST